MLNMEIEVKNWPMREAFAISRGTKTDDQSIVVTVHDSNGHVGRGEASGVSYKGETVDTMSSQLRGIQTAVERGIDRQALLKLLPPGGARCALDGALWDLEAKRDGKRAGETAGFPQLAVVSTAFTIGIRTIDGYRRAAEERAKFRTLKVKVDANNPIEAIRAVREGAPDARLIVDPNQAWGVDQLKDWAPELVDFGVVLLEQPIRVGDEPLLDGYRCPLKLCADELVNTEADLMSAKGRFDVINIKLDKSGGLTAALRLADDALSQGFELMVGCMGGSTLAMAPAMVLAQLCKFVDIDSPLLRMPDPNELMPYVDGVVNPPPAALWG